MAQFGLSLLETFRAIILPSPAHACRGSICGMEMLSPIYTRRNPAPVPRRATRITVPQRVSPAVRLLFTEMARLRITYQDVEDKSGVRRAGVKAWRTRNRPGLDSIEAALSVVGYEFVTLPTGRTLPPEITAELKPLADRLRIQMPEVIRLLAEQAYRDHHLDAIRAAETSETI